MPDRRLNSEGFPAPCGPMIPRSPPSAPPGLASATMRAPPMSSPRLRVARIGGFVTRLLEGRDRGLGVAGGDRLQHLDDEVAALAGDELHLEHWLQHRVVGSADVLLALRREELPAL